jgi:ketosteroid isomerase-like protein
MAISRANVPSDVRQEISDRIHAFFRLVDTGKAASTAAFFTDDAKLTFGPGSPNPGTIQGSAIPDAMAARERQTTAYTRHVVTNLIYQATGDHSVSVDYSLILFRSDDDTRSSVPAFLADVAETWSLRDEQWKLAERTVNPTFSRA